MDELSKKFIIDMFANNNEKVIAEIILSDLSDEEKINALLSKIEVGNNA